jgi:hypothetical protein
VRYAVDHMALLEAASERPRGSAHSRSFALTGLPTAASYRGTFNTVTQTGHSEAFTELVNVR